MSNSHAHAGFGLEKWMTIPALKWLTATPMLVKWEFRTPWGICDLVGVELSQTRVAARISGGQKTSIGPPSRVALLQLIPDASTGRTTDVESLRSQIDEPSSIFERDLRSLCQRRFVVRHDDGGLQRLTGWAPLHTRIVAIELKLSRIDEVISQARSHTAFATESFIGLPTEKAVRLASSERANQLREAGVGLLAVDPDAASVLICPAGRSTPDPVLQMHCVERFWRESFVTGKRA